MTLAARLREIGVTADLLRDLSPRHAALRDDPAALAVRLLRDGVRPSPAESHAIFAGHSPPPRDYRLEIVEGLYLFSAPEDVRGPGAGTAILYRAARQCTGDRLLDLGCGCGTLALLLGRARTVATDAHSRAMELTAFNAAANGIPPPDLRCGSWFEPVAGEHFDVIVSQPPYIPCPPGESPQPYYHAGPRGDEFARLILERAPAHLTPGGRALAFSDWPLAAGEGLRDRIPHRDARVTVWTSPHIAAAEYYAPQAAGIDAVRNCLVMVEPGEGYREIELLPHEWGRIDIQSLR